MEFDRDTGLVAVCAIRYCMGRMTYMPSTIVDWVKKYWVKLPLSSAPEGARSRLHLPGCQGCG